MKEIKISLKEYEKFIAYASGYGVLRDSILKMAELNTLEELKDEINACIWFIGKKEGELND